MIPNHHDHRPCQSASLDDSLDEGREFGMRASIAQTARKLDFKEPLRGLLPTRPKIVFSSMYGLRLQQAGHQSCQSWFGFMGVVLQVAVVRDPLLRVMHLRNKV